MGFIQPCFIRKNTPELRKKLEELGYTNVSLYNSPNQLNSIVTCAKYSNYNQTVSCFSINDSIDCETNEELFLALAALRDDSDYMQWFTDGKLWEKSNNDLPSHYMQLEGHKATVEEIIEHFKDK